MLTPSYLSRTRGVRAGHVVGALHHLEADVLLQTLNINKCHHSSVLLEYIFGTGFRKTQNAYLDNNTHISTESAATVLQFDHQTLRTLIEADLAEHLPLTGPPVHHEGHLGAGPGVDSAGRRRHRDHRDAAGAVDHRGPGPGHTSGVIKTNTEFTVKVKPSTSSN